LVHVKEDELGGNVDEANVTSMLRTTGSTLEVMKLESTRGHTNLICQQAGILCTRLQHVSLHGYCGISGEVFSELLRARANTLTELKLWWPALPPFEVHTTMEALQVLNITLEYLNCRDSMVAPIRHCPNLKFFNYFSDDEPTIPGVYLTALTEHCPHLQKLRGTMATGDAATFIALLEACTELTTVDLCESAENDGRVPTAGCCRQRSITAPRYEL
jgi:hypothetical protein